MEDGPEEKNYKNTGLTSNWMTLVLKGVSCIRLPLPEQEAYGQLWGGREEHHDTPVLGPYCST